MNTNIIEVIIHNYQAFMFAVFRINIFITSKNSFKRKKNIWKLSLHHLWIASSIMFGFLVDLILDNKINSTIPGQMKKNRLRNL